MPTIHTPVLFAVAALVLLAIPGPAVVYIAGRSISQGPRAGVVSVLGIHTGTLVHVLAAVGGLSAILVTSAVALSVVRYAGAAYLVFIGVRTIARRRAAPGPGEDTEVRPLRRLYLDGVIVNVLNPKTGLFFLAFLPQFVQPGPSPVWSQTLVLGLVFIGLGLFTDSLYALVGARVGRWMHRRRATRRRTAIFEGGLLVGLGLVTIAVPGTRHD